MLKKRREITGGYPRHLDLGSTGNARLHDIFDRESRGKLQMIVSDTGTGVHLERGAAVEQRSAGFSGTTSYLANRCKNAYIESFNGRMRDELHQRELPAFLDLDQARQMAAAPCVADYNTRRFALPRPVTGRRRLVRRVILTATGYCAAYHMRVSQACIRLVSATGAGGRINSRGSDRRWMKVQWQVRRQQRTRTTQRHLSDWRHYGSSQANSTNWVRLNNGLTTDEREFQWV